MKLKLNVSSKRRAELEKEFLQCGIEIDEDADLVVIEQSEYIDTLLAKKEDALYPIPVNEIIYIESLGHDVFLHTKTDTYRLTLRLKALELLLDPADFLRISSSIIIACGQIHAIRPALSSKFTLTMKNDDRVDVTRSYYHLFRERFGL